MKKVSSYDVHMYPQWANIPLQGLDRCMLTGGGTNAKYSTGTSEHTNGTISTVMNLHVQ